MRRLLAGLGVAGAASSLGAWVAASRWETGNVPPRWRADRWEVSRDGEEAWGHTRHLCPDAGSDAWIRFDEGDLAPRLEGAPADATACFAARVAPRYSRDRLSAEE